MKTICRMLKRDSKGFTLVELMVVLLIIGILVAIAIPVYGATQRNAKEKACKSNLRTIDGAIAQYYSEKGKWPESIDDLKTSGFLKDVPVCPAGGDNAAYELKGSEQTLHAVCEVEGHSY